MKKKLFIHALLPRRTNTSFHFKSLFRAHFTSLGINYHAFIISWQVINININKYVAHFFRKIVVFIMSACRGRTAQPSALLTGVPSASHAQGLGTAWLRVLLMEGTGLSGVSLCQTGILWRPSPCLARIVLECPRRSSGKGSNNRGLGRAVPTVGPAC